MAEQTAWQRPIVPPPEFSKATEEGKVKDDATEEAVETEQTEVEKRIETVREKGSANKRISQRATERFGQFNSDLGDIVV